MSTPRSASAQQRRGRFVVVEGLSAVGKSTVGGLAAQAAGAAFIPTLPSWLVDTRGRVDATRNALTRVHFWMMCNYAAGDVIAETLAAGRDVVAESYFYRTLATHAAMGVDPLPQIAWHAAPMPDITVLLTVDEQTRQERLQKRRGTGKFTYWTMLEESNVAATEAAFAQFDVLTVDTTGQSPAHVAARLADLVHGISAPAN